LKNKKSAKNIVEQVSNALTPVINDLGYEVWDIEYVKEGAEYFLRFTIDNDEGITIDDCETVHRAIDPLLDELDPIEDAYNLQVSSPGLERDVKYDWHYEVLAGETLEIHLFAPIEAYPAKKVFTGILVSYENAVITLNSNGTVYQIPHEAVSKATTVFDFDADKQQKKIL